MEAHGEEFPLQPALIAKEQGKCKETQKLRAKNKFQNSSV